MSTHRLSQPADKPIAIVLQEFLGKQRSRLKARTLGNYESVTSLFEDSMSGYGYMSLERTERALFERLYNARGQEHREFCQIFAAEKIPEHVGEFLGYFMVGKVMCGKGLKQAAAQS